MGSSSSPTNWFSRAWRSEDGLAGSTVVGLGQTPDGFLWVATEAGLVRFDGMRFQEIASLRDPALAFLVGRNTRLWLAKATTPGGGEVICWDAGRRRVFGSREGLPDRGADALVEDPAGTVWLSAANSVCRIDEDQCTVFSTEDGVPPGRGKTRLACDGRGQLWLARRNLLGAHRDGRFSTVLTLNEPCGALHGARSGGVWIGAGRRLLNYSGAGEPQDIGELAAGRANAEVTALYEDRRGRLWVGTQGAGLLLYSGGGFDQVPLANREILCLAEDGEGSLWVGTRGGGLVRVRPRAFGLQALRSDGSVEGVRSVCQDKGGTMWAVVQGGQLARNEGPLWRTLSAADGWSESAATCVTAAPEGGVWVGTQSHGLRWWHEGRVRVLDMQDGLASRSLTALLTAPSGDIWLGTVSSNAVQRLREGHLQTLMLPQEYGHFGSLVVDAAGGVWAATVGGVLARATRAALADETAHTLRAHHPIASLCATPDGSLWIGYRGLGVGRLLRGRFTRFGTEQGLWDDYILHIVADDAGRLWFAANRGLFSVTEKEFEAVAQSRQARVRSVVYGQDEGVPAFQAGSGFWPGAVRSADGRLWIPTFSGLLVVDPSRLTENREPPPVVMERVVVDGQVVAAYGASQEPPVPGTAVPLDLRHVQTPLRLAPGPRQVELEYTGLCFASPRNVTFKYRLQGLDSDWMEAGSRRIAYFNHLPPGDYRFEVMACDHNGVWSQQAAGLAFAVLPHFWQTAWFRLVGLATGTAGLVGTGWGIARRRARRRLAGMEQATAIEHERARIARDMHDEFGSRLTTIANLGELAQNPGASSADARSQLGSMTRQVRELINTLDEVVWTVSPENDSLPSVVAFLSDYAERSVGASGIRHRLELDPEYPPWRVTAEARHHLLLATKEALNNAVRHAAPETIRVKLHVHNGCLEVVISDDGHGFELGQARAAGHGLGNLAERMRQIQGRAEIRSVPGQGTVVALSVPLAADAEAT
ncbi:MAG TPA: two-component regulator propeller domain-containing protein [Verrucomicrobiota bacterium]|nr:two-component regulator propeller domain-containing protein [Verrucomicrobiota bacterium]HNU52968.1 two-component regulator propeller domain-containing protein [Verrucomicrobiota bacterium]